MLTRWLYNRLMEIAIGIGIGVAIAALFGKRKKHGQKSIPYDPSKTNARSETAEERKRRETDEIIAVILPTINSDK